MQRYVRWFLLGLLLLALAACGEASDEPAEGSDPGVTPVVTAAGEESEPEESSPADGGEEEEAGAVVRLVTHDSFNASEEVLAIFENEHGAEIEIVPLGDAGSLVNQSILSVNNPLGDVMFGIDNTFLARALNEDIFEPYESPNLSNVQEQFLIDSEHRVTPIDFGDVCINYDINWFEDHGLAAPSSLEDLIEPEYEGLTVVENPASSSPGLAFLLATVSTFGEDGWEQYWEALRDNDVLVTSSWSEAYYDRFTEGGGEGDRPIVVSYASSPPFTAGTTTSLVAPGSCFRQIEFAGVLKNAANPELARALIDFMLTPEFQNDVPEQMYVFPVIEEATLPDSFIQFALITDEPAEVTPEFIEENRDALIERWTDIVLR